MSVQYILDNTFSYVENEKLNQELEVTTSLKAPLHFVDDLTISKTEAGNLSLGAPVVETTQLQAAIAVIETVSVDTIIPYIGGGNIIVNGHLNLSTNSISDVSLFEGNSMRLGSIVNSTHGLLTLSNGTDNDSLVIITGEFGGSIATNGITAGNGSTTDIIDVGASMEFQQQYHIKPNNIKDSSGAFGTAGQVLKKSADNLGIEWLPDAIGTTPSLSEVLAVGSDATQQSITNVSNLSTDKLSIVSPDDASIAEFTVSNSNGQVNLNQAFESSKYIQSREGLSVYDDNGFTFQAESATNDITSSKNSNISGFGIVSASQFNPTYIAERTLWVSANNSNASPTGSYENPYTTIQAAVTYAESEYDNTYWYINVLAGTYAGFTVTKKVFIKGAAPSNPDTCSVGCQINSDITIIVDANDADMFNNMVGISGFLIAGSVINDTSTARHVLNISDCNLYQDSGSSGRLIHYNPSASDGRLQIYNSRIVNQSTAGLNPMIEVTVGMAKFGQSVFQCSGVQNCLTFSGTSRVDSIVLCSFTSTTSSTSAPAIVEVTSTSSSGFTFAQCSFVYSNAANKSQSSISSGILCASATTSTTLIVINSSFFLTGTSSQTNFAIQDSNFGIQGRQAIILFFSNNASLNTASQIRGTAGVSKFSLQAVA